MAQFAKTFGIYGDMAIVIERIAKAPKQVVVQPHIAVKSHQVSRVTVAPVAHPTARPFMTFHHVRDTASFGSPTVAAYAAATVGWLTTVSASRGGTGSGAWPSVAAGLAAVIVAIALLGLYMRRRRRIDALGDLHTRRGSG